MKRCLQMCKDMDVACPIVECRNWIDYESEFNCVLESVKNNNNMTLRQCAKRLGISFVRVKQIEDVALKKISHLLKKEAI